MVTSLEDSNPTFIRYLNFTSRFELPGVVTFRDI